MAFAIVAVPAVTEALSASPCARQPVRGRSAVRPRPIQGSISAVPLWPGASTTAVIALIGASVLALRQLGRGHKRTEQSGRGDLWLTSVAKRPRVVLTAQQGDGVVASLPYQAPDMPQRIVVAAPGPRGEKGKKPGKVEPTSVFIANGRDKQFSLDDHGFQLQASEFVPGDYYDSSWVVGNLYPACCELVKSATGAANVFAYNHVLRSKLQCEGSKRLVGCDRRVESPFHFVHNDVSGSTALQRVREFAMKPRPGDSLRAMLGAAPFFDQDELRAVLNGRWSFITCWRNFKPTPIQTRPLGLCEAFSIPREDLITLEMRHGGRVGEFIIAKHSSAHRWVYFPELRRDESILLKCWDSAAQEGNENMPCAHGLHSAFEDPTSPANAEDRESIEVRMLAFWPSAG